MEQSARESKRAIWLGLGLVLFLLVACLVFALVNSGPGFAVDGQQVRLRLVSAVTNYPFCPPEIPCPFSVVLPDQHWVVWVVRDQVGVKEDQPYFRKLIDIRVR